MSVKDIQTEKLEKTYTKDVSFKVLKGSEISDLSLKLEATFTFDEESGPIMNLHVSNDVLSGEEIRIKSALEAVSLGIIDIINEINPSENFTILLSLGSNIQLALDIYHEMFTEESINALNKLYEIEKIRLIKFATPNLNNAIAASQIPKVLERLETQRHEVVEKMRTALIVSY